MVSDLDRRLAAIALKQHSLISLGDVLAEGGSAQIPKRRCQAGFWEWVHPGVYRLAGVPWTYEARVMAALLAAPQGSLVSHLCACRLQGLGFKTAGIELTIPRGREFELKGVIVHTSRDLRYAKPVSPEGIPTTGPDRTLLDLAGRMKYSTSVKKAVEEGRRLELVSWSSLIECLADHSRQGRPGISKLREVVAVGAHRDEITDTDSELAALSLFREYGFPEPAMQHRLYGDEGILQAEMDFAYLDRMVDFEINGAVHLLPAVIRKDEKRDYWLAQRGWTVRRIWWEIPVFEPVEFVRIVRETLAGAPIVNH